MWVRTQVVEPRRLCLEPGIGGRDDIVAIIDEIPDRPCALFASFPSTCGQKEHWKPLNVTAKFPVGQTVEENGYSENKLEDSVHEDLADLCAPEAYREYCERASAVRVVMLKANVLAFKSHLLEYVAQRDFQMLYLPAPC